MTITYTDAEIIEIIHTALCNGLSELNSSGVELSINPDKYKACKEELKKVSTGAICLEDVLIQMLKTDKLEFIDVEGGGDEQSFDLVQATNNINKCSEDDQEYIRNILEENDDAWDASAVLQLCLYGEVIYG